MRQKDSTFRVSGFIPILVSFTQIFRGRPPSKVGALIGSRSRLPPPASGQTALHIAANNGHVETVKELLAVGAAHDIQEKDGGQGFRGALQNSTLFGNFLPLRCFNSFLDG